MTTPPHTPKLKLSYFDFHGGRGEPARLALSIGGIDFEDDRIPPATWAERKATTPFHGIPVLEVDGERITQSNTINRYVGRLTGLYPEDALEAARCDEIMDVVEEITTRMGATFGIRDPEALRAARAALVDGKFGKLLTLLSECLEARGGEWFADGRLTMADLKVYEIMRKLRSNTLDHVPADLCDRIAPALVAHYHRVKAQPGVAAHYARHGHEPPA